MEERINAKRSTKYMELNYNGTQRRVCVCLKETEKQRWKIRKGDREEIERANTDWNKKIDTDDDRSNTHIWNDDNKPVAC